MEKKIQILLSRLPELESKLSDPLVHEDQKLYKKLSREHAYLSDLHEEYSNFQNCQKELIDAKALLAEEGDREFYDFLQAQIAEFETKLTNSTNRLKTLLVPPDPNDDANVIVEIRAGTGGEEAALFVFDMLRMYRLYAGKMSWQVDTLSFSDAESGGYKEYIFSVTGKGSYRYLKYEAGTHRVQRVPTTETQGRVHTSAVTVAVLMEPTVEEKIHIDDKDLKIDTYRASGAGGQHVNTTDSAVRITHIPSGVVVYCQEERSQHKNKEKAMRVLSAKLAEEARNKALKERASMRALQVGSGDRSERIRTYNYSQNRVTDHRTGMTLYKLDQIMGGALEEISEGLVTHFYEKQLSFDDSNT